MDVERLFADFCRTREPRLLGDVFDACADDLFAVALHLCRDRADAEDLVQATFLAAIAKAHRWQPQRPLRPWLLGILHREARHLRRRARRAIDHARVNVPTPPEPPQLVLAAETRAAVAAAIPGLPQPYRDVLSLHLVDALAPGAIAERLQRSPGAVRTQLWRGLELLRGALPKGLAIGLAAELATRSPALASLAAVRAKVLAAAATRSVATTGAASLVLGGVLMSKLLAATAALAAAAFVWWNWPSADVAPSTLDLAATTPPAPAAAVEAPAPDAAARDAIATGPAPASAAQSAPAASDRSEPVAAGPFDVVILVVDTKGEAVRDATVSVFDHAFRDDPGGKQPTDRRADEPPQGTWRTDDLGRARVPIADGCLVTAGKRGVGWSGDVQLKRATYRDAEEVRLVLMPLATVRGRVLAADGTAGAGASVDGYQPPGWFSACQVMRTGNLPHSTADGEGRFDVQVLAGEQGSLWTQHAGRFARAQIPAIEPGAEAEVTLRVPGAFSVRGVLLGAEGEPLAGKVRLLAANAALDGGCRVTTDEHGAFEIFLSEGGAFVVLGGVEGRTSAREDVVLDEGRPHASVTLRTAPFVEVTGTVVDERREPIPGAWVGLSYVVERDAVHEQRSNLHGILPRGPADVNGAFRFLAPAGYRYRVVARAIPDNNDLYVNGPEIGVPASDVVVVVREADKQGFVVTGRIVAANDGAAVPGVRIERQHIYESGASSDDAGKSDDGTFRIGPFATGRRYAFAFEADGFAKTIVGPFDATARTEELVVRMPRCGSIRCVVLRADGTPASRAFVSLQQLPDPDLFGRAWQGEADADGCIRFADVVPGSFRVHARATTIVERSTTSDTAVRPGEESAVQIVLQN